MLIAQTAHKPAAGTGNFLRIKRKVLFLCHLYRYLNEIRQKLFTAERSAADAETADKLCLIAYAYLTKLDSCFEYSRKVFYKLAEIDSSVGCEVENQLCIVKGLFHINKLHFKLSRGNLFLADSKGFLFFIFIRIITLDIGGSRYSDDRAQWQDDL